MNALHERGARRRQSVIAFHDDVRLIEREHIGVGRRHSKARRNVLTQMLVFNESVEAWNAGFDDVGGRCAPSGDTPSAKRSRSRFRRLRSTGCYGTAGRTARTKMTAKIRTAKPTAASRIH